MFSGSREMRQPMLDHHMESSSVECLAVITFEPSKMGLKYEGNYVTAVCDQAKKAGVKTGWKIQAVNGEEMPDNTSIIKQTICETTNRKELTEITFIPLDRSYSGQNLEIENKNKKKLSLREKLFSVNSPRVSFQDGYSSQPSIFKDNVVMHDPLFTYAVVFICIAVFVLEMGFNSWEFEPFKINPLYGPSVKTLDKLGAKDTEKIVDEGQIQRLFIPMWLHGGIIHLGFNIFGFYKISKNLEIAYGFFPIAFIYIISGIFSMVTSTIFLPMTITVGASGAIFGLLGACWADFGYNYSMIQNKCCYSMSLFLSTVISLIFGLLPLLDNFCHIGGFISGLICGLIVCFNSETKKLPFLRFASASLLILLFSTSIIVLFLNVDSNNWCKWCHYLSCVDTPWWSCTATHTCSYSMYKNGTQLITCSNGVKHWMNGGDIERNCRIACPIF